jgi:hypothetical protein
MSRASKPPCSRAGRNTGGNQPRSTGTKICASSRWISNAMLSPA